MKRLMIFGMYTIVLVKCAGAQEQLTVKQDADKLFERYEYFKSLPLYLKLVIKSKTDVHILERVADCYRNLNRYEDAEAWYARVAADAKASKISHYYYAGVLLRNQKFDLAKKQYQLYFNNDDYAQLTLKLAVCDSAALWMGQKPVYKIKNEEFLNTPYSDWGVSYNGKTGIIFASDRLTGNQDVDNRTGNNWTKLYATGISSSSEIKELSIAVDDNTTFNDGYHVGPMALNNTADTAYITVNTEISPKELPIDKAAVKSTQRLYTRRLQLLMAVKKDDQWQISGSFPYNNVLEYSVGDAALSKNGQVIYFTSDMPGGQGKTDIWYCDKRVDGTWSKPINCGKAINTKEEETFPTIGGDGALYYSSKGLPGMGGYDIYKTIGKEADWATPLNLKFPVNTTSDDFYLVTRDGMSGYLSSDRQGGQGSDDIYSFTRNTDDTVPAQQVTKVPSPGSSLAEPVKPPAQFSLKTIYYDLDRSNIRPDAAVELEKLAILLKQNPTLKIELSSYTDSRAPADYNLALSKRRARAAIAYLVNAGIDQSRLTAKYYGENFLVNKCADNVKCTEEEHQLNRRTEFKVIAGIN